LIIQTLKIKKKLFALILSFSILFGNTLPVFAFNLNGNNSIAIERTDSTTVKTKIDEKEPSTKQQNNVQKAKPTSRVTYSILYYIIAKFLLLNPFSRPA